MKAIKSFFSSTSSSTSSSKNRLCQYCNKKFRCAQPDQAYCSVNCSRMLEWEQLTFQHAEKLRRERPRPCQDLDRVIQQVKGSPARGSLASNECGRPSSSARSRTQSSFQPRHTPSSHPLIHKRSVSENLHMPDVSRRALRSLPPPYPSTSSAGNTTAQMLIPHCIPEEVPIITTHRASPHRDGRNTRPSSKSSSSGSQSPAMWADSLPPSPSTMTSLGHEFDEGVYNANGEPFCASGLTQVGRQNKSSSDLLSRNPRPLLNRSPLSDMPFPASSSPDAQGCSTHAPFANASALGLSMRPFLTRKPSQSSSTTTIQATARVPRPMPHPRYRDSALKLRPGFDRRAPRPRSNSFGGFQLMTPNGP